MSRHEWRRKKSEKHQRIWEAQRRADAKRRSSLITPANEAGSLFLAFCKLMVVVLGVAFILGAKIIWHIVAAILSRRR